MNNGRPYILDEMRCFGPNGFIFMFKFFDVGKNLIKKIDFLLSMLLFLPQE